MKLLIGAYFLVSISFSECGTNPDKHDASIKSKKSDSLTDSAAVANKEGKGKELFARIMDTIHKAHLTKDILVKNKWQWDVAANCISSCKFFATGQGVEYDCELDEKFEITYFIKMDTLQVQEFDTPDMDNINRKRIKSADYKFLYNGKFLILIDSKAYSLNGRTWTPDIQEVIRYERK